MRNIPLLDSVLALIVLIFILLASVLLSGCAPVVQTVNPEVHTPYPISLPQLRIKNSGATDIHNLTVLFPDSRIHFGDVPAGATTDYKPAPQGVYNYAAYEYEVSGNLITQPVIDWVGESPRPAGDYTYIIALDPSQPSMLRIELVQVLQEK